MVKFLDVFSNSDGKIIKKFTLRPPRFTISRPASPDSPSLDVDFKDIVNLNEKHIEQSPDKGICHDFFLNEDSYASAYDELSFSQVNIFLNVSHAKYAVSTPSSHNTYFQKPN